MRVAILVRLPAKIFIFLAWSRACFAESHQVITQDHTAVREVEREAENIRQVAALYILATGRSSEENNDEDVMFFAETFNDQILFDRINITGNTITMTINSNQTISTNIELELGDLMLLVFSLYVDRTKFRRMISVWNRPPKNILKLLSAAVNFVDNPFGGATKMKRFRTNLILILETLGASGLDSIEKPDAIEGFTRGNMRKILELYAGTDNQCINFADQADTSGVWDNSFIARRINFSKNSKAFAIFLQLVRLCDITELNIRTCEIKRPVSIEMQNILTRCNVTRLVPPINLQSCKNLFLTAESDKTVADRMWPRLSEVGWFSRKRDDLDGEEFVDILKVPEFAFCRSLVRPAVRPDDFSALESMRIYGNVSAEMVDCLGHAINLRRLRIIQCHDLPPLGFLKHLTGLESLYVFGTKLVEIPGELFTCLPNLLSLSILCNQKLTKLPKEVVQLKELRELIVSYNSLYSIPDEFCNCSKLTKVDLSYNGLRSLPGRLSELQELKYLDISGNYCPELITTITNCTSLETLLAMDNLISRLPADFCGLKNLRKLNVTFNLLTEVPQDIDNLPVLTELILLNNRLCDLPQSLGRLNYLRVLLLSNNMFRKIPDFVRGMKGRNGLLAVYLSGNPLDWDDTPGQMGLKALRDLFGNCIMPEHEYRELFLRHMRDPEFCRELQGDNPVWWNIEILNGLRLLLPPPHKLAKADLVGIWSEILKACVMDEEVLSKEALYELIEVLYDLGLSDLRGHEISASNKIAMKDYLECVTHAIKAKIEQSGTDCATAILVQLGDSLRNCPSGQAGALMEIYRLHCLDQNSDDFESYVKEFVAREKDDKFTAAVALPNHPQNVHLVLYWKKQLKNVLGLATEYTDSYMRQGPDQFRDDPEAVMRAFLGKFNPEAIIGALRTTINSSGRVGSAWLYLSRDEIMSGEAAGLLFEMAEGEDSVAHGYPSTIKEAGAEEILVRIGILVRKDPALCAGCGLPI